MKVSFYIKEEDLAQVNNFLEGSHEDEYTITAYRNSKEFKGFTLITVNYFEYLKLKVILKFIE